MHPYIPEGLDAAVPAPELLRKSIGTGEIYQALCVKCDEYHNLHLDLGPIKGLIPREETALITGNSRDYAILSRVGRRVSFQVLGFDSQGNAVCSRKAAQAEARDYFLSALCPGDIIPALVQNPAKCGIFCDIGCGFTALMRIARCCVSRLESTADLFRPDQRIYAAILDVDDTAGRVLLTGRELLGSWEENADRFRTGQTVPGIVRSVMAYGAFVELTPNLSGLAENVGDVRPGDPVSVYIRSILPEKHKIKLNIIELLPKQPCVPKPEYFVKSGHMDRWEYYPGSRAVTVF